MPFLDARIARRYGLLVSTFRCENYSDVQGTPTCGRRGWRDDDRTSPMKLAAARARLVRLQAERLAAREAGVAEPSPYMTHLSAAIADARVDYTTRAVVEIAALRSDLAGPALG